MSIRTRTVLAVLGCLAAVAAGAVTWKTNQYARAFEASSVGEMKAVIVGRFGEPSVREVQEHAFLRYAAEGCKSPCVERLWWEHPVLRDIEAWSIEFSREEKVIHKAHWVSP
jgi:hypothetical protein